MQHMRPGQNKNRMRGGRPNNRFKGHGGGGGMNRSFDSNGPDVKLRGTAAQIYEKYLTLARDANVAGDRVSAENYLQHAEHYYRVMLANGFNPNRPPPPQNGMVAGQGGQPGQGQVPGQPGGQPGLQGPAVPGAPQPVVEGMRSGGDAGAEQPDALYADNDPYNRF
jgi:hypothetical protein